MEELEGRDLHGKVRTTDPLWLACGVKQLLMRVSRAQPRALPDTPLKKERRQRQVLPPAHSASGLSAAQDGYSWQSGLDGPFVPCLSTH